MTSRGGALRERDAASAARRIVGALAHLHAAGFVHRDVKLENLLLATPGDYGTLKLADFGFATRACDAAGYRDAAFERRDEKGDGLRGTAEYAAPEVLADLGGPAGGGGNEKEKEKEKEKEREKRARREESKDPGRRSGDSRASSDAAAEARRRGRSSRDSGEGGRGRGGPRSARAEVDVWSFGVTAFLMLAGYHPFDASREAYSARMRMDATLAKEFAKPAWASVSEDAKRVLRETLRSDPKKRTDARALTKDPWIASSR
jgi:serine/threonine protein kinase